MNIGSLNKVEAASDRSSLKHIGIIVFDGVILADVVGAADVFGVGDKLISTAFPGTTRYQVSIMSISGGMVASSAAVQIMTAPISQFDDQQFDTLLIASGTGNFDAYRDPTLIAWLQKKRTQVRRLAAICTGVFVIGAAGFLAGRRATTHWALVDKLSREFSTVIIDRESQIVEDDNIFTSCDVGMATDLALRLLEKDLGPAVAQRVAQNLVVCQRRRDTSPNTLARPVESIRNSKIHKASLWFVEHLSDPVSVIDAANFVSMSERNFIRQFKRETGQTPHDFLINLRLEAVRQQLSETDLPIDKIARRCGLFSGANVAKLFRKQMWPSPTEYRKGFRLHQENIA
ncbi:GlxA family transcriptional regulator [Glaciimonas immobilis]|uniref:Transcriptional regulator GlxA family with amidase domain n=1 Tax=Glaciimonas immobilis TaxID=728004 RepID=A0A840RUX9_9BURK|nr:DJ-1/PfpI family protein [Glaciimonas immobilis]KAF3999980.1 helix-turn-helix domain-containing protein [Glaciimonas immobilis]MBB5200484.1 transcriptional regulator GlxA family with amidase domain [Glaciimonas immobilis]